MGRRGRFHSRPNAARRLRGFSRLKGDAATLRGRSEAASANAHATACWPFIAPSLAAIVIARHRRARGRQWPRHATTPLRRHRDLFEYTLRIALPNEDARGEGSGGAVILFVKRRNTL